MRIGGGAVSIADVTDRTARDLGFVRPFWLNEIRAGRAFTGFSHLGPTASNYSHVQLINPSGSGITVTIREILIWCDTADLILFSTHNTALSSLSMAGINLLAGGTAGTGTVREENNVAQQGTSMERLQILANTPTFIVTDWHMELGAGEGVLFVPGTVNQRMGMAARWTEL